MKMWILRSAVGNENVSLVCTKTELGEKKKKINQLLPRGGDGRARHPAGRERRRGFSRDRNGARRGVSCPGDPAHACAHAGAPWVPLLSRTPHAGQSIPGDGD